MIYIGIFQNKRKCLMDSSASISIISEISVPKSNHIEKCNKSIRDHSSQLNIPGQVSLKLKLVRSNL